MTDGTHYKRKPPKHSTEQLQNALTAVKSKYHVIVDSNSYDICNTSFRRSKIRVPYVHFFKFCFFFFLGTQGHTLSYGIVRFSQ